MSFLPNKDPAGAVNSEQAQQRMDVGVLAGWLFVAVTLAFVAARLYCKFRITKTPWWDDCLITLAWAALVVAVTISTTNSGFGAHAWQLQLEQIQQVLIRIVLISIFLSISLGMGKTSFVMTLSRAVGPGKMRTMLWIMVGTADLGLMVSACLLFAHCSPVEKSWKPWIPGHCWQPTVLHNVVIFMSAISAAVDFVLVAVAWRLILNMQLNWKEKIAAAFGVSAGLLAGIAAIIKCLFISRTVHRDFTYSGRRLMLWALLEVALTIIAPCIPVLRVLLEKTIRSEASRTWTGDSRRRTVGGGVPGDDSGPYCRPRGATNSTKRPSTATSGRALTTRSSVDHRQYYLNGWDGFKAGRVGNSTIIAADRGGGGGWLEGRDDDVLEMQERARWRDAAGWRSKSAPSLGIGGCFKPGHHRDGGGGGAGRGSVTVVVGDGGASTKKRSLADDAGEDVESARRAAQLVVSRSDPTYGRNPRFSLAGGILMTHEVEVRVQNGDDTDSYVSADGDGSDAGDVSRDEECRIMGRNSSHL